MDRAEKIIMWCLVFTGKLKRDGVRAYAAEASFFMILSFFPFLMLLLTAVQFTPIAPEQVFDMIEQLTPFVVTEGIEQMVGSIYNHSYAILSWTAIVALWTSGKGMIGLADGLNSVGQIEETRNYFVIRIQAAFYTVLMLITLLISIGILVFGYRIQEYLRSVVPLIARYPVVTLTLQMGISLLTLVVLFEAFYVLLPNQRRSFGSQLPGAIFTAVSWAVFSYGFSIYLDYAGSMSVIYGSLTTLIVVLLWLYCCMYLFFVGAEINSYIADPGSFEYW